MKIECMDVGGTSFRWALIENEKVIHQTTFPTPPFSEMEQFITQTVAQMRKSFPDFQPDVSVMGLPAPVDGWKMRSSSPLRQKAILDLSHWQKFFPNPFVIENDLNLAVRAENNRGAGKQWKNFYLLTLSTGIGSGIVLNGKPLSGNAGEFGHCILDASPDAPESDCPHRGCWVAFSSGAGIARQASKKTGMKMSTEEAFARENNPKIKEIILEARRRNAQGIGIMLNAFPVDGIVIMGSAGLNQFEKIIPSASEIDTFTVNPIPPIISTSLGDDIGIWGAYEYGKEWLNK